MDFVVDTVEKLHPNLKNAINWTTAHSKFDQKLQVNDILIG